MKSRYDSTRWEGLWKRYRSIKFDRTPGLAMPILWNLALSGDHGAKAELASTFAKEGRAADPFSRAGLTYRSDKGGCEYAAQHLAMDAFNRRDLKSYRHWLRRAARFDPDCLRQLKRFETRLPHAVAHEIGRGRPYNRFD